MILNRRRQTPAAWLYDTANDRSKLGRLRWVLDPNADKIVARDDGAGAGPARGFLGDVMSGYSDKIMTYDYQNLEKLHSDIQDEVTRFMEERHKIIEQAVEKWTKGDPGLAHGLVMEIHQPDGMQVLRVIAGPLWETGGAGPVVLVLPPMFLRVS